MPPALREAGLGLKSPAIRTKIDQLHGIVLPAGRYHFETHAQESSLPPFLKLLKVHCRAAHQVNRKAIRGIEHARAVGHRFSAGHSSMEVRYAVRQRCAETG